MLLVGASNLQSEQGRALTGALSSNAAMQTVCRV
jgi:hypothetical protein